jgi:hypothetical protein
MSELAPFIQTEISKFNQEINEAELKELVVKFKDLRIADVHDKEGYNAVYDARQVLKDKRIEITKKGKTIRESAIAFQKAVIVRENELVDLIEPTEKLLHAEEKRIDQERERIKKEEEERENQRISVRIQRLANVKYVADYGQLKSLSDDSFEELLSEVTKEFEAEQEKEKQRLAEEAELKRQAEERLEQERQQLKKQQEELAEQKRKIQEEQEAIRKTQLEKEAEAMRALEAEQQKFRQEQERIKEENEARERALKFQQEAIEAEKRAIQEQKEAEERERLRVIQEEADRKAREEQAAKDEIERQNRINAEAEQKSKYFEDRQRFAFLSQQLEVNFINSSVWSSMKSERGKTASYEVQSLIRNAYAMCKEHSSEKENE